MSLVDIELIVVASISGVSSFLLPFYSAINNSGRNLKKYDFTAILLQIITLAFVVSLVLRIRNCEIFIIKQEACFY